MVITYFTKIYSRRQSPFKFTKYLLNIIKIFPKTIHTLYNPNITGTDDDISSFTLLRVFMITKEKLYKLKAHFGEISFSTSQGQIFLVKNNIFIAFGVFFNFFILEFAVSMKT